MRAVPSNRIPHLEGRANMNTPDFSTVIPELDARGFVVVPKVFDAATCSEMQSWYNEDRFRKTVVMARHGFGRGEYRYFSYPLPDHLSHVRTNWYPTLAELANTWTQRRARGEQHEQFPLTHNAFLKQCQANGQHQPTPLILKYGEGDYNCLHRDLYGDIVFPFQVAFLLSEPNRDFTGGEFVLVENRPRQQSVASVVPLTQGDAVIFSVDEHPIRSAKGWSTAQMRHGVSAIRSGHRMTCGVIFHDATT
jgi:uncharacterized protein